MGGHAANGNVGEGTRWVSVRICIIFSISDIPNSLFLPLPLALDLDLHIYSIPQRHLLPIETLFPRNPVHPLRQTLHSTPPHPPPSSPIKSHTRTTAPSQVFRARVLYHYYYHQLRCRERMESRDAATFRPCLFFKTDISWGGFLSLDGIIMRGNGHRERTNETHALLLKRLVAALDPPSSIRRVSSSLRQRLIPPTS